jgi:glutathione S-transferase
MPVTLLLLLLLLLCHLQDKHIDFATWPELKQQTPFGQVPVLQVESQMIAQSAAIGEPKRCPSQLL